MLIPPCRGCQDRKPVCHATCDRYKTWKARHVAGMAAQSKYKTADGLRSDSIKKKSRKTDAR